MTVKLIHIGDNNVVIIPEKILHELHITDKTELDIAYDDDEIVIKKAIPSIDSLDFPKVDINSGIHTNLNDLKGCISFSKEEIENDDRLSDILSK